MPVLNWRNTGCCFCAVRAAAYRAHAPSSSVFPFQTALHALEHCTTDNLVERFDHGEIHPPEAVVKTHVGAYRYTFAAILLPTENATCKSKCLSFLTTIARLSDFTSR